MVHVLSNIINDSATLLNLFSILVGKGVNLSQIVLQLLKLFIQLIAVEEIKAPSDILILFDWIRELGYLLWFLNSIWVPHDLGFILP